ncbi:MAG: hypothetical protein LW701_06180 [Fluviicola sp.]|jgi:hypothetical protein|nr:hypothetical protein [Fluviicola sp.]
MKLLVSLSFFFLVLNLQAQSKKYYRSAFMDAFGKCEGMYPISEEEAMTMNYYVFEYDTINRLYDVKSCKMDDAVGVYSPILNGIRLSYIYKDSEVQIQSYIEGDDLENLYEPNSFYWQVKFNDQKRVSSIITFEVSEYDDEFFEEHGQVIYSYNEQAELISMNVSGNHPFYFGEGKDKTVSVKLNSKNQIIEETYEFLDEVEIKEIVKVEHLYTENGNLVFEKKYNRSNELYEIEPLICYKTFLYDSNGYVNQITNYNALNEIVSFLNNETTSLNKPSIITYLNDNRGNVLAINFFNHKNESFLVDDSIVTIEYSYDTLNNLISLFNFGLNKKPVIDKNGFSGQRFQYHEIGRISEESYFGVNQLPTNNSHGVHKIVYEFDSYDFTNAEFYLNENNEPVEDFSGVHRYEFEYVYDDEGFGKKLIKALDKDLNFIGIDEETELDGEAIKYRIMLNDNSLIVKECWYDSLTKPMELPEGFHKVEYNYSLNDILLEERYYDSKNQLKYIPTKGYAKKTLTIDDTLSLDREIKFYNQNSQLCRNLDSVAVIKFKYNSSNLISERIQLDEFENPITNITCYYKELNKYDLSGNLIETAYYNSKNKLMEDRFGFAIYRFVYDGYLLKEKSFYSKKKKLKLDNKNIAIYVFEYDSNGNLIKEQYKNCKSKFTENIDSVATIAIDYYPNQQIKSVEARNLLGNLVNTKLEGKICARIEYVYGTEENEISIKYFSTSNQEIEEGHE